MELLRRLLLIICTLAAVSALKAPAPVLYHVERPDFAGELARHPYRWEHKGQTPEQYMEEETRGLVLALSAKSMQAVADTLRTQPGGYIKANDPVIKDIVGPINSRHPTRYLKEKGAPTGHFLRISRLSPGWYGLKQAPYLYQHPYALWSPLLFLAGLLFYIFLPRRRFDRDTLCYGAGFAAVIGPDLVAWMFVTGFFTLGLGVGLSDAPGGFSTLLSSNLIIPMFILWAFSLFGLYMFTISARYAAMGLQYSAGQLIRYSPSGSQKISARDILSVQLGQWQASKWLTRFGFLISVLNWRALGPTLLNASRKDPQLEVHLTGGKIWKFTLTGAQHLESFINSLQKHRIKIDPALCKKKPL